MLRPFISNNIVFAIAVLFIVITGCSSIKHAESDNKPKPYSPETHIDFIVEAVNNSPVQVKLVIYNLTGETVLNLVDEMKYPGKYSVKWDGKGHNGESLKSGVYYYITYIGGKEVEKKKLVLLK